MSNSKHTPGPWHVTINAAQDLVCAGDEVIADCTTGDLPDITQANARLIAAAPELLQALKAIAEAWDSPLELRALKYEQLETAKWAIAKAEGR